MEAQEKEMKESVITGATYPVSTGRTGSISIGSIVPVVFSQDEIRVMSVNIKLDIDNKKVYEQVKKDFPFFEEKVDICIHLAAQINVHESLKNPSKSFFSNVIGTYNILEEAKKHNVKVVLIGTCMVYDMANNGAISENSPVKPASPYAGSKLAAENLADSYARGLGLPVVILRPFNTYGPFQKSNMEGGVVSIFIKNFLENKPLPVFGDGTQTRDLLYIEDCSDFIVRASFSDKTNGEVLNAGLGKDIAIKDLALMVCKDSSKIQFVPHIHPQSEIKRLICNYSKVKRLLNWEPLTSLEEGIEKTKEWIKANYLLV